VPIVNDSRHNSHFIIAEFAVVITPCQDRCEPIRIFLEVANQNGFAAAAWTLGLSPAVVTRQVAELEAQLGVQLLVRTTRKVSLTHAGASYASRVRPLVAGLAQAAEDMRQQSGSLSGLLTDWSPPDIWLTAYYPPYDRLPSKVAAFSDFIEAAIRDNAKASALSLS
jgi:DNA-binding transcriptional LysR family regulator